MRDVPVRLPWAAAAFAELCTRCVDCALACKERIVVAGDGGFPEVDFKRGECTFCGDCVKACKTGALSRTVEPPWLFKAQVNDRCLSVKGITCRSCADVCDTRAIRFQLQVGGGAVLSIDSENCTGCGACVSVCPVQAVTVSNEKIAESASQSSSVGTDRQEGYV